MIIATMLTRHMEIRIDAKTYKEFEADRETLYAIPECKYQRDRKIWILDNPSSRLDIPWIKVAVEARKAQLPLFKEFA
jgi:hypothetical protein